MKIQLSEWMAQNWPVALFFCGVWVLICLGVVVKSRNLAAQGAAVALALLVGYIGWHVLVVQQLVS